MDFKFKKFFVFGIGAGIALLGLYFLVLSLANSFSHATEQFLEMWYWILILVAGFGIQVGLYTFIRESQRKTPTKFLATSGGVSTGSMIICCLHHLADVLPILGIAALAVFLTQYQVFFIILGILANLIGIIIMLEIIKKYQYLGLIKKIVIGVSLPVLLITFLLINNQLETTVSAMDLPSRIDSQSGVNFKVNPVEFNLANPVRFKIEVDTHSGSLDFDLTKISILKDNEGSEYSPLEWQGPSPGGHHISGLLIFPKLNSEVKYIKLSIRAINQNSPLIFEWNLE